MELTIQVNRLYINLTENYIVDSFPQPYCTYNCQNSLDFLAVQTAIELMNTEKIIQVNRLYTHAVNRIYDGTETR